MTIAPQITSLTQLTNLINSFTSVKKLDNLYVEVTPSELSLLTEEYMLTLSETEKDLFRQFNPESYFDEIYQRNKCRVHFKVSRETDS